MVGLYLHAIERYTLWNKNQRGLSYTFLIQAQKLFLVNGHENFIFNNSDLYATFAQILPNEKSMVLLSQIIKIQQHVCPQVIIELEIMYKQIESDKILMLCLRNTFNLIKNYKNQQKILKVQRTFILVGVKCSQLKFHNYCLIMP